MAPPWTLEDAEWQLDLAKIIDEPYLGFIPDRKSDKAGSDIMKEIQGLSPAEQQAKLVEYMKNGNIPDFLREPKPISVDINGKTITYYAMPDYMAVGNDTDYVLVPMTGHMAQEVALWYEMVPPTAQMADQIHQQSSVKFDAGPDGLMKNWAVDGTDAPDKWLQHNESIETLKQSRGHVDGEFVSGHKKDIVMSDWVSTAAGPGSASPNVGNDKLGLYSPSYTQNQREQQMEKQTGKDQPPMADAARHHPDYIDYSQGLRLVSPIVYVDSHDGSDPVPVHIGEGLAGQGQHGSDISKALSGEGTMQKPVIFADR